MCSAQYIVRQDGSVPGAINDVTRTSDPIDRAQNRRAFSSVLRDLVEGLGELRRHDGDSELTQRDYPQPSRRREVDCGIAEASYCTTPKDH